MHKIESSILDCYHKYKSNLENLNQQVQTLFIAYSGGLDSTVLLFASQQLFNKKLIPKIGALHVNHGLESEANNWQIHCQLVCDTHSIEFTSKELKLLSSGKKSSENIARNARYNFFESHLEQNSLMAFAHHQNDQVETLLFRLFRGTGISGAGAIPESRKLGVGKLIRPFLNISKDELLTYANKNHLTWIEDSSNFENEYSRNIIRNTILPLIKKSWPKVTDTLNSFTHIAREQNEILLEVASNDLLSISSDNNNQINISLFIKLSKARQKNLLHYWISSNLKNNSSKNNYSRATNQEIVELLKQLKKYFNEGFSECSKAFKLNVKLGDWRIRFYDNKLWLCDSCEPIKLEKNILWNNISQPIEIFYQQEIMPIKLRNSESELSIRRPVDDEVVTIRPRVGGERVKPQYRDKSCDLKKIYQELNIPHWEREWLPIIYYNDQIACVPGVFVNKDLSTKSTNTVIKYILNNNNNNNRNRNRNKL